MNSSASLLVLLFQRLFHSSKDDCPPSPVGFMPRSLTVPDVATSPLDVIAPASSLPIAIHTNNTDEDTCSCLSTSSSSCGSLSSSASSCSSCSSNSSISTSFFINEDLLSPLVVPPSDCSSTAALSDLLCDHYVQSQTEDDKKDVPLETFRMFEAPSPDDDERWCVWESPKHWTPIDDKQPFDEKPPLPPKKQAAPPEHHRRVRDLRVNNAHLRMIVVEANMMRAQKIVGPLRPRGYLPKRLDPFVSNRPSCLRYPVK
ncbi:hypothetical protein BJV82DRAFT_626481 [Fennellomyces sp. T-0311]|nr:hypothetical protein BJV82DRAFT_626481 [Fennellomyces sp. T-0311]